MLLGLSRQEVQEWNDSLHSYEKAKRTKRPFGRAVPAIERRSTIDVLERELRFNPVLQSFRDKREESRTIEQEELQRANEQMRHLRNEYKHATDYDIITLGQNPILPNRSLSLPREVRKKQHRDPAFQGYNIINGRHYDQGYLQKIGFRQQNHHERNLHPEQPRNYNIITGRYGHDHQQRQAAEQAELDRQALEREQKMRVFDTVNSQYYNPEIQAQYQKQRREKQIEHAQASPQLPPSYVNREEYVQADLTVPSETMLELDRKAALAKQRYKLRRAVEDEQRMRGEYLSAKSELQARKRVQSGRLMEQRSREFDIINAGRYLSGRPEKVFGKEVVGSLGKSSLIKSRGFSQFQQ